MKPRVVALGEVLWDLLPAGPQLGGAPANLACHVAALGGRAALLSRVGDDELGRRACRQLAGRGVDVRQVAADPQAPTGTVGVELAADGQPRFTIHAPAAWDRLAADAGALAAVAAADAVCFGTLARRTPAARQAVQQLLAAAPPGRLVLCDINLRAPFYDRAVIEASLTAANTLKLNETELPVLAELFGLPAGLEQQVEALAGRFGLAAVVLTLGAAGSCAWADGCWERHPGRSVRVADTIGAGDSFTAAFVLGRLRGWPLPEILRAATEVAAYVCTQSGATPELPPAITAPFRG